MASTSPSFSNLHGFGYREAPSGYQLGKSAVEQWRRVDAKLELVCLYSDRRTEEERGWYTVNNSEWCELRFGQMLTDLTNGCWNIHPRTGIRCRKIERVGQKPLQNKPSQETESNSKQFRCKLWKSCLNEVKPEENEESIQLKNHADYRPSNQNHKEAESEWDCSLWNWQRNHQSNVNALILDRQIVWANLVVLRFGEELHGRF